MSDDTEDLAKMLQNIHIVNNDGTQRQMDEEESLDLAQLLTQISENVEEERPRMIRAIAQLEEDIPELEIEELGGNCPVQARGTYKGMPFYFRARGTHASLSVGSTNDDNAEKADYSYPHLYAEVRVTEEGDDYGAGWLTPEELLVVFPFLIEHLQEQTHEDNEARLQEYIDVINKMVELMKKQKEELD